MHNGQSSCSPPAGRLLLEREYELAKLTDMLDRGAGGDARVVLIEGSPGLGKTSLINWVSEQARERGFAVLAARGGSLERTLGWGVARQLFEELVVRSSPSRRRSLLRGSAALAGPVLSLDDTLDETDSAGPGALKDFRLVHGLYWLICNVCQRAPAALLIDDVQWCDDATLEWLLYLVRRSERLPLLVVVATRSGETPRSDLLRLIAAEPITETVTLSPLGLTATEALLERAYGVHVDAEFGLACHDWTGGNPLFVTELAAELATEGIDPVRSSAPRVSTLRPAGASRVMLLRFTRLSGPALDLARAVAVLESAAELRHASLLAGLDDDDTAPALDELVAARVLGAEGPLRFTHPLIGGVVYEDVPPSRRAAMHRRAARVLADAGADPGVIGTHLLRSTPSGDPWVVTELRSAAEREMSKGSPSTAIEFLRRAVAEPPFADAVDRVLLDLGRCEVQSGDTAGIDTLQSALATSTDVRQRAQIAMPLARVLLGTGEATAAVDVALAAADELGWDDVDLRLQLEALIVNLARSDRSLIQLIPQHLRTAREHADEDTYGGRLIVAQLSWGLTCIAAPADQVVDCARRALASGRLISEAPTAPEAYLGAIHMLALADELEEADDLLAQAIALAQEHGSLPSFSGASCFRANAAYLRGELERAELLARDALRLSADLGALALVDGLASAYLALALIARGAVDDAPALLGDDPASLETSSVTWASETMFAAGAGAVASGQAARGAELLLGCGRRALAWGVINPAWLPWRSSAALALHQLGDTAEATRLSEEELVLARRCGSRRPLGIALRARGLVAGGPRGLELLRESSAVLAESPARLEHARALVSLGHALRRSNSRAEARSVLAEGLAIAERCGAAPLAGEARTELSAAGARPRSVLRTGSDALTASERRVCELAAAGRSNPEIAQLLFVTRATIESHLHSAYRTLDIRSRNELAAALSAPSQ
jgi:DNA-binding CsgD family transcriptional regulator